MLILRLWILPLKIRLTFDQFITRYYSGLTVVDYGEYFKLTVDLYFDHGRSLEYRMCWSATSSRGPTPFQILSMVCLDFKFQITT